MSKYYSKQRLNLKLKLSTVLHFQFCRSKHDVLSTFRPEILPRSRSAVDYYRRQSSLNSKADDDVSIPFPSPPPSTPVSVGCGCRGWPQRDRGDQMIKKTVKSRESEEAGSLVSDSLFFSDDDEELMSLESRKRRIKKMRKMRRGGGRGHGKEKETAAAMGGVAVLKTSDDPYEDFKRSMVEMILEKEMLEAEELEELLRCFLSLNSGNYHAVIVEAFTHIWDQLFCTSSPHHNSHTN